MADIQTLINNIPDAQDGDVLTSKYHNTIKTALQAISDALGGTPSQTVSQTIQTTFLPTAAGSNNWIVNLGVAADAGPPSTNGWIPLNLPDGAIIQKMEARGATTNAAAKGFLTLVIIPLGGNAGTNLIVIDVTNAGNPFDKSATPNVPGLTPTALLQLQTVQNSQFKYIIQGVVFSPGGTPAASISINDLQVVYTKK
jgi:hypothetical protein